MYIRDRRKKSFALIPARGGSKGVIEKNIRDLNGIPLIAYTINAAKKSRYVDRVVVTTDSRRIAEVSRQYGAGVPFLRPDELAQDHSKSIDAAVHGVKTLERMGDFYDILLWLQPTSPLRDSDDMDRSLEHFIEMGEEGLASVSEVTDHPILIRSIGPDGRVIRLLNQSSTCRRQDLPPYYRVNGAICIYKVEDIDCDTSLNDAPIPFVMSKEHSIDIDGLEDFARAEMVLKSREKDQNPDER